MRSSKAIRDGFRGYFQKQGHELLPSGPIVPGNDPTLMFANAGMVQFKDVFTGKESRPYKRATTSQKCIRISGKHNDLENVGVTARHHTFFEMLGNFSFGDYFKEEAIVYAWDVLTKVLDIPKERLVITVFGGEGKLGADTEAEALWRKIAGVPNERIIRMGAKDNFWSMGDTGPCGPCSEIHYFHGEGQVDLSKFDSEPGLDGRGWVELWNLVFMQFDRSADGTLTPLPAQSVDTGAGLERLSAVAQGVFSNYDTDLLRPVVDLASQISGKKYGASLSPDDISMRVIADHARTAAFLIAEGVFPDRDARPYVLRRVMRRAIRHAHRLGINKLFFHECTQRVVEIMGSEYPDLQERRALISEITQQEEDRFRATLKRGLDRIHSYDFGAEKTLPGDVAFELYDTYGFPLDLQDVIGREQGFSVDHAGFDKALAAAKERSQGSKVGDAAVQAAYKQLANKHTTKFVGYDVDPATGAQIEKCSSRIQAILVEGEERDVLGRDEIGEIVVAETPFYAESGGQTGDRGVIRVGDAELAVEDTQRPAGSLVVHRGRVVRGSISRVDSKKEATLVELEVDHESRSATRRNHSATHLLHLGLRTVVGPQAMQKGSMVGPDRLRFDYSASKPLTTEEIAKIEDIVNERVLWNAEITTNVLPMAEAKARGAIGIFEEKYGETVRMLTIGDSIELCGGTHARRTGDIGAFKILSDNGLSAGVRRIEAATGFNALKYMRQLETELTNASRLLKGTPFQTVDKVERALSHQKDQQREIEQLKRQLMSGGSKDLASEARKIGDVTVLSGRVDISDAAAMREMADKLRDKLDPAVIVLGAASDDGKVVLICTVSKSLTKQYQAGKLIKEIAGMVGGGGGGRPDFAQAGGSEPDKLDAALAHAYTLISA